MTTKIRLLDIFDRLLGHFGQRNWWPGDTQLEIAIGAILTQNTSWKNVELAIANLKKQKLIEARRLYEIDEQSLAGVIKSAGFFNIKAKRIKNFIQSFSDQYDASFDKLAGLDTDILRDWLLSINGIGEETADSIILYATEKPVFVVDAYTKRFLRNHGLGDGNERYRDVQQFFMDNLPHDTYLFNEYHALLVCLCQNNCKKKPLCSGCPLMIRDRM